MIESFGCLVRMKARRLGALLSCALLLLGFSPVAMAEPSALPAEYRLAPISSAEVPLGLSPDGSMIATFELDSSSGYIRIYRTSDFIRIMETELAEPQMWPTDKKAVWSPDGKYIAFRSLRRVPRELLMLRSSCIFVIDVGTGGIIRVSDERYKDRLDYSNLSLYYDPSFGSDGKSVVYHKYLSGVTQVVSVGIKDGKESRLYSSASKGNYCAAFPLIGDELLVYEDPAAPADLNRILVSDTGDGRSRNLLEIAEAGAPTMLEVRDLATDRKSALVFRWAIAGADRGYDAIERIYLLKLSGDPGGYSSKPMYVPDAREILDASLAPDGSYAVLVAREPPAATGKGGAVRVSKLDLRAGTSTFLLSDAVGGAAPGFYAGRGSRLTNGLFVSDSNLLVYCEDGFRLYALR
jgi:hypothetical protein